MSNKKYFSVDVSNDIHIVELHETLEQARQSCLNSAVDAYDFANDLDEFETYTGHDLPFAVYGVVLGRAISRTRPLTNEEKESGHYDEYTNVIINPPEIVALNGWISVEERLPPSETPVIGLCNILNMNVILIVSKEIADSEYFWVAINHNGPDYDNAIEVTHWQPLPNPPQTENKTQTNKNNF